MAFVNYGVGNIVVSVNGRQITNWSQNEGDISEEYIDPKRTLYRGQGGNGCYSEIVSQGFQVTLRVLAGTPDAAFLHGLYKSGAIITYTRTQVGTMENVIATEGICINEETTTRGGGAPSPDGFIFQFNTVEVTKGGEA